MTKKWQFALVLLLVAVYSLVFYFILTYQYRVDFSSFYSATLALKEGENPYQVLTAYYLPEVKKLSANLNPPIVLWLFTPITQFSYHSALVLWSALSFLMGLVGAGLAFYQACSAEFLRRNWLNLYLVYLALFASLMNTAITQFGTVLLFLLMLGYHFYLKKRDYLAGLCWGLIIGLKLFPALLFFFLLKQKRWKAFMLTLGSFLLSCLIPLLVYGATIYSQYLSMMTRVLWYGDSWNASLFGFMFRLFIDTSDAHQSLLWIKTLYLALFLIVLAWYWKKLSSQTNQSLNHQPFCLTLVMMLLLSPFGWLYYFPLLILPQTLCWLNLVNEKSISAKETLLFLVCFFLINFPLDYVNAGDMHALVERLNFLSFYFYSLLLFAYLLVQTPTLSRVDKAADSETKDYFIPATLIILGFGLIVPAISLIMRLFSLPGTP